MVLVNILTKFPDLQRLVLIFDKQGSNEDFCIDEIGVYLTFLRLSPHLCLFLWGDFTVSYWILQCCIVIRRSLNSIIFYRFQMTLLPSWRHIIKIFTSCQIIIENFLIKHVNSNWRVKLTSLVQMYFVKLYTFTNYVVQLF